MINYFRFLIAVLFFMSLFFTSIAQKNTFYIEHSIISSKLLFEEKLDDFYDRNGGRISFLYSRTEMNKPVITSSFRFGYKRLIFENIKMGMWARKLTRGLKSPYSFNIVQDTSTLSDTYGGYDLIYRLKSMEIGLSIDYKLYTNKAISFYVGLRPALDIYNHLEIKPNVFNRSRGTATPPGDERRHFNSGKYGFFERYKEHIRSDFYRGSLYLSGAIEYKTIIKGLIFTTSFEIGGSTPLKTKDPAPLSFLPDGWIYLSSLQFGTAYNF